MLRIARSVSLNFTRKLYEPSIKHLVRNNRSISSKYEDALKRFEDRIAFNSVLGVKKHEAKKRRQLDRHLMFQKDDEPKTVEDVEEVLVVKVKKNQNLPFSTFSRFLKVDKSNEIEPNKDDNKVPKNWLKDYEFYNEADNGNLSTNGTADPEVPVSDVPCNGCGALLHCKEESIPGYIPSEIFKGRSDNELKTFHCQRCHFLINYNTAINVIVKPEDYIDIISTIKDKKALAIIMVDLIDFPCSLFTGLNNILGSNRQVFIVGNKIDLLPRDQPHYLRHIKQCLKAEAMKKGFIEKNIKYISLISAKTGYGIEELINKLHGVWKYHGDVYLVGCSNVGKSSLFNALLKSDLCKVEAIDLVRRATASPWPGTTLRTLKFPILKISDSQVAMRKERLTQIQKSKQEGRLQRIIQARKTKDIKYVTPIGDIGMTFANKKTEYRDTTAQPHESGHDRNMPTLDEKSDEYAQSKWCFDTPGVIHQDQILHLLTTDEIIKTIPKEMIRPRVFLMKPNLTLFLGGLGRLDYIDGPEDSRVSVYSSLDLPVSICQTEDAEEFYESFLGSDLLGVPMDSGEERLANWPRLEAKDENIVIEGEDKLLTVCDILLSSAGWIGINLPKGVTGTFKAWTPEKRGIYVRQPSLMRYGLKLRGARIRKTLAFVPGKPFTLKKVK